LETTDQPIERIAAEAGFGSAITFRARFREQVGVSPLHYRRNFRRRDPGPPLARRRLDHRPSA
ncbi:MAG TPA: helix-turn-helix domain-containing protein, partial [Streptosporangiaceae bacterium]|nr:helix-turn-helix domain-containing protein [Streptosporangiaceae bacterium]